VRALEAEGIPSMESLLQSRHRAAITDHANDIAHVLP
jgi:hypothetical protein